MSTKQSQPVSERLSDGYGSHLYFKEGKLKQYVNGQESDVDRGTVIARDITGSKTADLPAIGSNTPDVQIELNASAGYIVGGLVVLEVRNGGALVPCVITSQYTADNGKTLGIRFRHCGLVDGHMTRWKARLLEVKA